MRRFWKLVSASLLVLVLVSSVSGSVFRENVSAADRAGAQVDRPLVNHVKAVLYETGIAPAWNDFKKWFWTNTPQWIQNLRDSAS